MKRETNLQESNRAEAFHMWMSSPMPMVTFLRPVGSKRPEVERVKTLDVSRLVKWRSCGTFLGHIAEGNAPFVLN